MKPTVPIESTRQLVQPPIVTPSSDSEQFRADNALQNDVIRYLRENSLGCSPTVVSFTGEHFVKTLTAALWYLDPHHKQFEDR